MEEVIRVALHSVQRGVGVRGQVAGRAEAFACDLPRRPDAFGIHGSAADIEPVRLGHVPGIAGQIVVQEQLGLAIPAEARACYGCGIGAELVLLPAKPSPSRSISPTETAR